VLTSTHVRQKRGENASEPTPCVRCRCSSGQAIDAIAPADGQRCAPFVALSPQTTALERNKT